MFATPTKTIGLPRRNRLAPFLVGTALLFAACGGAADTTDEPGVAALPEATESASGADGENNKDTDTEEGDQDSEMTAEEAQLAFSQCLEEQGIEDPFGSSSGGEAIGDADDDTGGTAALSFDSEEDFEAFDKAQRECSELLGDAFGEFEATPEQEAMMADAQLKFEQCMADNGFEMNEGAIELDEGDFEKMEEATSECDAAFDEINEAFEGEGEGN